MSRTKSGKDLHMKRKYNDKTIQFTPSPTNRKVLTPGLRVTVSRFKKAQKTCQKSIPILLMKSIPMETPKSLIQSYNCTECNSTFDARHKLKSTPENSLKVNL